MTRLKTIPITDKRAKAMLARAAANKINTYPEPGGYSVTLLTDKGNMYDGVSYKSETQTLTMHSEATALANAAIHGEKNVVAITGPNCHICKQLIWESALRSGINVQIVLEEDGRVKLVSITDLMLYPWPDEEGNH